ncbi:TPA: transposase, partial [Candidatus Bipolaricaulota bacterium]|nr:transposase [Candidatus Bipolaricaulota bacterium]
MIRSYKYRLYPKRRQGKKLDRILEIHRQLYNAALQERREAWKRCRVSISYTDQANQLKEIRRFDEDAAWLNYSSVQQTLRRLDKAFRAFFRRVSAGDKPGFPRFKGKGHFKSVCYVYGDGIKLRSGRLYIQNVGLVRIFQHRPIPEDGEIKMAILKRDSLGHWYVIFQVELPDRKFLPNDRPDVGIDMGLEYFATLSTGERIENPRWLREAEEKLALLQRKRSRCKQGSKRYRELTRQIARLHQRITNRRRDFQHKLSHRLVNEFGLIVHEDLNVNSLCRSQVSKSMADAAWAEFLAMLDYKAESAGSRVIGVDPKGTSQICPMCGCFVPKSLSDRWHICPHCGYIAP